MSILIFHQTSCIHPDTKRRDFEHGRAHGSEVVRTIGSIFLCFFCSNFLCGWANELGREHKMSPCRDHGTGWDFFSLFFCICFLEVLCEQLWEVSGKIYTYLVIRKKSHYNLLTIVIFLIYFLSDLHQIYIA